MMSEIRCRYSGDREQAIVSYLYGDPGGEAGGGAAAFGEHLSTCDRCRSELAAFESVRASLTRWAPPEPAGLETHSWGPPSASARALADRRSLGESWSGGPIGPSGRSIRLKRDPTGLAFRGRDVPAWAQAAAAVLLLGVAAGIANLDVRYDGSGLRVRTGWVAPAPAVESLPADEGPWRAELIALEQRLRADLGPTPASPIAVNAADTAGTLGPEALRRMRTLVEESERRQQRELALRLGEAMREVSVQRQEDLVRIDRNIGAMQSNTGREMLRQRSDLLNYVTVRTAARPR